MEQFIAELLKERNRYKSYAAEKALEALLSAKEDRDLKEAEAIECHNTSLGLERAYELARNHVNGN